MTARSPGQENATVTVTHVEEPYLLTEAVRPTAADYRRANRLFEHTLGCRCSTCRLTADLGSVVRRQEKESDDR